MTAAASNRLPVLGGHEASRRRLDARELCYRTLAQGSKSFAFAARLLPKPTRVDAAVLYTFCRRVDDAIDLAPCGEQRRAWFGLNERVQGVYRGEPQGDVAWQAFAELVGALGLPQSYPQELLAGMHMDVAGTHYDTLDDLLLYCHRVAGVVGLMMCHVLRVERDEALRHAAHLGIALQLTNICRDVAEDWQLGRLYVPRSVLAQSGAENLAAELGRPLPEAAALPLARAIERLLGLADHFYRSADAGLALLPWRAALAIRTARLIYARIGGRLRARGHDVRAGRAVVPTYEKLFLLARSTVTSLAALHAHNPLKAGYRLPQRVLHFPDVLPVSA
jgi:phytoene synthase